jgi:hypothetical protein
MARTRATTDECSSNVVARPSFESRRAKPPRGSMVARALDPRLRGGLHAGLRADPRVPALDDGRRRGARAEPDLRGATNFYEAVLQTLRRPPLPEGLRRSD